MDFLGDGEGREIHIYLVPTIFWSPYGDYLIQSLQPPVRQELLSLMKWRLDNSSTAHQKSRWLVHSEGDQDFNMHTSTLINSTLW